MGGKRVEPTGRYEVRDHPSLDGLVVIWWIPDVGPHSATNITLGVERVPLMAEALADWEMAHHAAPEPRRGGLRSVTDDGTV